MSVIHDRVWSVNGMSKKAQMMIVILSSIFILVFLISFILMEAPLGKGKTVYLTSSFIDETSKYIASQHGTEESADTNTNKNSSEKININTAAVEDLTKLTGIGPILAERIVAYRSKYGFFTKIEQIKQVEGIGEKKFEAIKDYITVGSLDGRQA